MSVTPTPTIVAAETLATDTDLWALAYLLNAEWSEGVVLRTSFRTDISTSKADGEQRRGLLGKPMRMMDADLQSMSQPQVLGLQATLDRMGAARSMAPLYCDQSFLTAATASGGTVLNCDTQYRRISAGARVVVFDKKAGTFSVRVVQSKTSSTITLTSTLGTDMPAGAMVFPLIECRLNLESSGEVKGEYYCRLKVTFVELPGTWSLDLTQTIGSTPFGFSTYGGFPILSTPVDYGQQISFGTKRTGNYSNIGVTQVTNVSGSRARRVRSLPFRFVNRKEAWSLIQFFDSRAGRLFPFWLPSPTADYEIVAFTGGGVQVKAVSALIDWTFRPYICLVKSDGTVQVRTITNKSRAGSVDTLTLDSTFDTSGRIVRLTSAQLMRFDTDEISEKWVTDEICDIALPFVEVPNEVAISLSNVLEPSTDSLAGAFDPLAGGESSGILAPMFYWPCPAPSERPLGRAADLLMPLKILVTIDGAAIGKDPNYTISYNGQVSDELLAAIGGTYPLTYVGPVDATTSHHWGHTQVVSGGPLFLHNIPAVSRFRWRGTKQYVGPDGVETITVDFMAEWNTGTNGAAGALFNIYVYSSEVNRNYTDGTSYGGASFTKDDPAVLLGLNKKMHPQMVLMASVPTTWTAACGDSGEACDNNDMTTNPHVTDGFKACYSYANPAPWHGNNPAHSIENTVFWLSRDFTTGKDYPCRAVSLGGDCPSSEIFDHLIIENSLGSGRTGLMPIEAPGWDEQKGELDILHGCAVQVVACLPPQPLIDCCLSHPDHLFGGTGGGGNPSCWRSPPNSPHRCDPEQAGHEGEVCCFPTDSIVTVEVLQKCVDQVTCPDNPEDNALLRGSATKTYTMTPCYVDYFANGTTSGNANSRLFKWATRLAIPGYAWNNQNDNFTSGNSLGLIAERGTWAYTGGHASATGTSSNAHIKKLADFQTFDYLNGTVEVDCLTSEPQGLALRIQSTNPDEGYAVLATPGSGTGAIRIYAFTGSGKTLLAELTGKTFSAPYRLSVVFEGPLIQATVDGDAGLRLEVTDCTYWTRGYVGLIGDSNNTCTFDNFNIIDNDPAGYSEAFVTFTSAGFRLHIPSEIMPLAFNPACEYVPTGTCYKTTIICPEQIDREWGQDCVALPDHTPPPGMSRCKCDSTGPLTGFRAATVRVNKTCNLPVCEEGAVNLCAGIDVFADRYRPDE